MVQSLFGEPGAAGPRSVSASESQGPSDEAGNEEGEPGAKGNRGRSLVNDTGDGSIDGISRHRYFR